MGLVESWAAGDVEAIWGLGGGSHACVGAHALCVCECGEFKLMPAVFDYPPFYLLRQDVSLNVELKNPS